MPIVFALDSRVVNNHEFVPLFFANALQSQDPKTRQAALKALDYIRYTFFGQYLPNEIFEALMKSLDDNNPKVRQSAIEAIDFHSHYTSQLKLENQQKVLLTLLKMLEDGNANVRQQAVYSLRNFSLHSAPLLQSNQRKVFLALLKMLEDDNADVRQQAIQSLKSYFHKDLIESTYIIERLVKLIKNQEGEVRENALDALSDIEFDSLESAEQFIFGLAMELKDENNTIRQTALDILRHINLNIDSTNYYSYLLKKSILPTLLQILQQKNGYESIYLNSLYIFISLNLSQDNLINLSSFLRQVKPNKDNLRIHLDIAFLLFDKNYYDSEHINSIILNGLSHPDPSIRIETLSKLYLPHYFQQEEKQKMIDIFEDNIFFKIETLLRDDFWIIRYSAASVLIGISPQTRNLPEITSILLEGSQHKDDTIREYANGELYKLNSRVAHSAIVASTRHSAKQYLYTYDCLTPSGVEGVESIPSNLLVELLSEEDTRHIVSTHIAFRAIEVLGQKNNEKINSLIEQLTLILQFQHNVDSLPEEILTDRNQDIRRSVVYIFGTILEYLYNDRDERDIDRVIAATWKQKSTNTLMEIFEDKTENLEVRWMAAIFLQKTGLDLTSFFQENNLLNPNNFRCSNTLRHGEPPYYLGMRFDNYNGNCIYDDAQGCGAGIVELFDELREILSRQKAGE